MDLHLPEPPADPKAQRATDRRRLARAFKLSLAFVALLAVVFGVQAMIDWRPFAIEPRAPLGLLGILTAPLLHGSPEHLMANAGALLLLGTLTFMLYPRAAPRATRSLTISVCTLDVALWRSVSPDSNRPLTSPPSSR